MVAQRSDEIRRASAREVREKTVEAFHAELIEQGIERAFMVFENGEFTLSHPGVLSPLRAFFELSQDFSRHEGVFIGREEGIDALFFAGVHDTRRGLAQGGLRFKPYANMAEVLVDVLRLAQGMTRKNALASLWWGGGKGVVPMTRAMAGNPAYRQEGSPERLELFRAYGRFVASLNGIYYTAEDVGTKTSDLNAVLSQNRFTTCIGGELGGSGNPSAHTAQGVFVALRAAWRFLTGSDDLAGVGVAVQGVGNVGGPLVELLDDAGARVWITDIDQQALQDLKAERPRLEIVESDAIFDTEADIFAPCAIGAQVNSRTIPRLRARLICGAANNILEEAADAERLRRRGIAYVPDYLCNRMGITNCADEWQGYLEGDVRLAAERVAPDTVRVLRHARSQMITTAAAADQLADIAAGELHPLIGHRGRRIIDHLIASDWAEVRKRGEGEESTGGNPRPAFEAGSDEPVLRLRWEREGLFRGEGPTLVAAPISAAGRPHLGSVLSALLLDVRARALEALRNPRPRRRLGSDPGGLALQLTVERSLPFEREEIGRSRFIERCADTYQHHDESIREQLQQLGVGFDPDAWLEAESRAGVEATRRLFYALEDSGLLRRERRLTYFDPSAQTVLISPDVLRTQVTVDERFTVRFRTAEGEEIETQTFFPELLAGAVALAVDQDGPYGRLAGEEVLDPLGELLGAERRLPVLMGEGLGTPAKFLVPAHDREDHEWIRTTGAQSLEERPAMDVQGRILLPGQPPLGREEARRLVVQQLGHAVERREGSWKVDAFRGRKSRTLVNLGTSEQLFLDLSGAAGHLRRAIETGAVTFSHPRWRRRSLAWLEQLEPWCISRQYWWGQPVPDGPEGDVFSVWFALAAWSLQATGWPAAASPEPAAEVFVDSELLTLWALPSQLVSMAICGRPAFARMEVHGSLHVVERVLDAREGIPQDAEDEERFLTRFVQRPMRQRAGNGVEPDTWIRRFGADALRLGYLLSLPRDPRDVVTLAESNLRRARRVVRRFNGKVTGLFHLTRRLDPSVPLPEPLLADRWLLCRASQAAAEAQGALERNDPRSAAHGLAAAVDDLTRYASVAAGRRYREGGLQTIRATVAEVVSRLSRGFSSLCPFFFEKLGSWTRAGRGSAWSEPVPTEQDTWLVELVEHLDGLGGEVEVSSTDATHVALLSRGSEELAALTELSVRVAERPAEGEVEWVGDCAVVELGGDE